MQVLMLYTKAEGGSRAYVGDLTFLCGKSFKLESQAKAQGGSMTNPSHMTSLPPFLKHNIDTCIIKYTEYYNRSGYSYGTRIPTFVCYWYGIRTAHAQ